MSILARYRKRGGFLQLLQLIETSKPVKQAQLLDVVEKEDPQWAQLIREKKLTPDIVLSWGNEHLEVIFSNMIARHASIVICNIGREKIREFRETLLLDKYNELYDIIETLGTPTAGEIDAAHNHMLEIVRYLDEEKKIHLRFIDPALDVTEAA